MAEDALRIYTRATREKLSMGRGIGTLHAASIAAAVRIHYLPRSIEEIIAVTDLNRRTFLRTFRVISLNILPKKNLKVQHFGVACYVNKFCEEFGVPMTTHNVAIKVIDQANMNGMTIEGKDPKGIASAAIYLATIASGAKITQKQIADLSQLTEVTLRARVKELRRYQTRVLFRD